MSDSPATSAEGSHTPPPASGDSAMQAPSRGSLLIIFLTVFIDLLGFGMVLPLLPLYADQFAVAGSLNVGMQLGLLMASFSAMQFVFAPFWGMLSDRIGRRPVLIIGLGGSVAFYLLFAFATVQGSMFWLFISRIGAGIAGATIPTAQAYIADSTAKESRAKGMALIGMAFGLGFTFGPLLGLLAVPTAGGAPGPGPGYAAAGLSLVALLMAIFRLPESLKPGDGVHASHHGFVNLGSFRLAVMVPSIALILLALLVCVFSFANFETTLSLLIKDNGKIVESPFQMSFRQVCLTFAFIGFTLAMVQGGLVRRMAGRVSEARLAAMGAATEMVGFALMLQAIRAESVGLLYVVLAIVVTGFAFMQPSLNGLLSRRSDPAKQGAILGVGQSVSALARILGSGLGIPLLAVQLQLPFYVAIGLMAVGLMLVLAAGSRGGDFSAKNAG
ncbi:MAG: MFS transporter [Planctomycetales bacterium]|nr:MFS transporter [Planctomycetales bacterium]